MSNLTLKKNSDQKMKPKFKKKLKQAIKWYDNKTYKKAEKECENILKIYPKNGETKSLKGLIYYSQNRKKEGLDLIKEGISLNNKSKTSWHVYGLMHRLDYNYAMSIKCYESALEIDPYDSSIIRDSSLLRLVSGDLEGFQDKSFILLKRFPEVKSNWVSCIFATYINGYYEKSKELFDMFHKKIEKELIKNKYKYSEYLLFGALIYKKASPDTFLSFLDKIEPFILDKTKFYILKAEKLLNTNKKECQLLLKKEIYKNSEELEYHKLLFKSYEIDLMSENKNIIKNKFQGNEDLKCVYKKLIKLFPNSLIANSISISFLDESNKQFCLKNCFGKRKNCFELLKGLNLSNNDELVIEKKDLFDVKRLISSGNFKKAEIKCKKILDNKNDLKIDALLLLSKIEKKKNNYQKSFEYAEKARQMEPNDRYLNTIAVKTSIRAGNLEKALDILYLIIDEKNRNREYLIKLQYIWLEIAVGKYFFLKKEYLKALKNFNRVVKVN